MRGIPWRLIVGGVLTAALLDLPFPIAGPLPEWRTVFAWFALVPLLVELLRLPLRGDGRSRRWILGRSFLGGWLSGALWFGTNCYWVYGTMHSYGGMGPALAAFSLVLFSIYLGFWFGAFALALAVLRLATLGQKYAWLATAAIPFLWTGMELALARIPEFPWDLLGYSQVDNGLLTRLAPWTGVYGISFVLAAANALLAAGLLPHPWDAAKRRFHISPGRLCGGLGILVGVVAFADYQIHAPVPSLKAIAVLVQPNLDVASDDVWVGQEWDRKIAQFQRLGVRTCAPFIAGIPENGAPTVIPQCIVPAPPPDLIIWPESPAPFQERDARFQSAMAGIAQADQAPMIVGSVGMDEDAAKQQYDIYNSATVFSLDGAEAGRYDKMHLVPFGEYVPMRQAFFFVRKLTDQLTDTSIGQSRKVFRIGSSDGQSHLYGVFICYESVFGDEIRQFAKNGAEVLVNISDDGWYGDTSAPWQHLNMVRMRAIENRRWILRDTNNGTTASIDPYGTVRQSIPRHQVDALPAQYGFNSERTFYTDHGDVFAGVCAILSLALVLWSARSLLAGLSSGAKAPSV